MQVVRFETTTLDGGRGRVLVPIPFDPDEVWQPKARHLVAGTIEGAKVRGAIENHEGAWLLVLGKMWASDCGIGVGAKVTVELAPEGPQRGDLADDLAASLAANPMAAAFWDTLAQFYRKAYLRWIDGTRGKPELRAKRIAEVVTLLEAGVKQRTRP